MWGGENMAENSDIKLLHKRPASITVICIISFILLLVFLASIIILFKLFMQKGENIIIPIILMPFFVINLIAWVGIWYMRKWAAYIALGIMIVFIIRSIGSTQRDLYYIVPGIIYYTISIFILLKNYKAFS